jgi:asparagine N-glycosylation enzyme membrane subunit Stt3
MEDERVRVHEDEPLRRRRLAVLFRLALYVPHAIVVTLWSLVAAPAIAVAWLALLIEGRLPAWLHRFIAAFVRYVGQVTAWFFLLSARYPDPLHTHTHPFAIELPERPRQPRLVTLFRLVLAIPALLLATALRVVLTLSSVPAWFAGLVLGRTTAGLEELGTFCLRYELEALAYALLLTARYPRLVPAESRPSPASDLPAA